MKRIALIAGGAGGGGEGDNPVSRTISAPELYHRLLREEEEAGHKRSVETFTSLSAFNQSKTPAYKRHQAHRPVTQQRHHPRHYNRRLINIALFKIILFIYFHTQRLQNDFILGIN